MKSVQLFSAIIICTHPIYALNFFNFLMRNSFPQYYSSNLFNNFQPKKKQDRSIFTANGARDKLFKQKLRNIIYDDNFQQQRALSASSLRYLNDFSGRGGHENEGQSTMVSPIPRTPLTVNQISPMTPFNLSVMKPPRPISLHMQRNQLRRPFRIKSGTIIRTIPVDPGFRHLPVTPATSMHSALHTKQIPKVKYPVMFGTRLELQEPQPAPIRNYNKDGTRFVTPKRQYINFINTQSQYLNEINTIKPKRVQFETNNMDDLPEIYATVTTHLNSEAYNSAYKTAAFSPSDDIKPVQEIVEEEEEVVQDDGFQFRVNGVVQNHQIKEKKK